MYSSTHLSQPVSLSTIQDKNQTKSTSQGRTAFETGWSSWSDCSAEHVNLSTRKFWVTIGNNALNIELLAWIEVGIESKPCITEMNIIANCVSSFKYPRNQTPVLGQTDSILPSTTVINDLVNFISIVNVYDNEHKKNKNQTQAYPRLTLIAEQDAVSSTPSILSSRQITLSTRQDQQVETDYPLAQRSVKKTQPTLTLGLKQRSNDTRSTKHNSIQLPQAATQKSSRVSISYLRATTSEVNQPFTRSALKNNEDIGNSTPDNIVNDSHNQSINHQSIDIHPIFSSFGYSATQQTTNHTLSVLQSLALTVPAHNYSNADSFVGSTYAQRIILGSGSSSTSKTQILETSLRPTFIRSSMQTTSSIFRAAKTANTSKHNTWLVESIITAITSFLVVIIIIIAICHFMIKQCALK